MATLKSQNDYVFTPLSVKELLRQNVGQTLASWIIALAVTTPEEVDAHRFLRER